jgi:hypothetical protein
MHTARATAAGFIMTAVLDLILILVVGTGDDAGACGAEKPADGAGRV